MRSIISTGKLFVDYLSELKRTRIQKLEKRKERGPGARAPRRALKNNTLS
jgi:hypothetical protein